MPKSAYFVGKVVQVFAVTVLIIAILLASGVAVLRRRPPLGQRTGSPSSGSRRWGRRPARCWASPSPRLARNGRSASATVTPVALVLQFISGVFFLFRQVPNWLQTVAALFPLKWMAQGLRSVFLPDALAAEEPAGSWELGRVALVLGIWCVVGLVLCVRTFRWQDRGVRLGPRPRRSESAEHR